MSENHTDGTVMPEETAVDDAIFGTAKVLKKRINECSQEEYISGREEVVYLWACVNSRGFCSHSQGAETSAEPLSIDQWLNVVDEAATLGANWLVLTVSDPLHQCPDVWTLSQWAQDTYDMTVGLHPKEGGLCPEDMKAVAQLDLENTRLLLREEWVEARDLAEKAGITVWTANPQPPGERPRCKGPTRLIFVNDKGVLYTCGIVEGNSKYHLGHVAEKSLKKVVTDPARPRRVEKELHVVSESCDGCPARMAVFFT